MFTTKFDVFFDIFWPKNIASRDGCVLLKRVVAKLQGETQHPSLTWNFVTHGFLDPSAFPDTMVIEIHYGGSKTLRR